MKFVLSLLLFLLTLTSCSPNQQVISVAPLPIKNDYYHQHVGPIFERKCVACHSCYNAPCQLDLTSFEGVQRGASKVNIYDFPLLNSNSPTRLGIDARNPTEWRKKGFFSVLEPIQGKSLLTEVIQDVDPKIFKNHQFNPEEERSCRDDPTRTDFFASNPRGHMPYGFPDLTKQERSHIIEWVKQGSPAPSQTYESAIRRSAHMHAEKVIETWEDYLNQGDLKSRLRSRYIYEHLFLALIVFDNMPGEYFRLIRSSNAEGEATEIPTVHPYDDPGAKFSYRFKKYIRVVMDKTNIPYRLGPQKLLRWKELFDNTQLLPGKDEFPAYGASGSNAFKTFSRISPQSRYRFLLDDAQYHLMTFIKGPVCRGQTALNVINDHLWVMFTSPETDPTLKSTKFMNELGGEMYPPTSVEDKLVGSDRFTKNFWRSLKQKYELYEEGDLNMNASLIWDGDQGKNNNALLTVFRHFDSAHVLKGALGPEPKTVWVIDYHIFEDIYYNLVAGYNVFGPVIHQVNSRLYMDISRIASEDLFLSFMPTTERLQMRKTWTQDSPYKKQSLKMKLVKKVIGTVQEEMTTTYPYLGLKLKTSNSLSKTDFLNKLFGSKFSGPGFVRKQQWAEKIFPAELQKRQPFVSFIPEVIFLRVRGMGPEMYSLLRHKYHYNVSMLFFEDFRSEAKNDYASVVEGVAASYPNLYMEIDSSELTQWQQALVRIRTQKDYDAFLKKYAISRHQPDFWEKNEWFFLQGQKLLGQESGRFDLSRYEQF